MKETIVYLKDMVLERRDAPVLAGITLSIDRGEFVYLVGKTGSGKSTLLKVLYGAMQPSSGEALVAGFDLRKLKKRQVYRLRRKMGIIFQDYNLLYDRNVEQNLAFAMLASGWKQGREMKERLYEVLRQVGLEAKARQMIYQLSGGEQQRIAIARALVNKPEIIIADEATGNLDPHTSEEILRLLQDLAIKSNTAVIFATHDYRIIEKFPSRIYQCTEHQVIPVENVQAIAF